MNKFVNMLGITLVTLLPACCVHNSLRHPEPRSTLPEQLQEQTVALDRWIGVVGEDEDGDPEYGEVDPDMDPKAELKTYCAGVWVTKDTILTAEHCVADLGRPKEPPLMKFLRMLTGEKEPAWDPTGQPLFFSAWGDIKDFSGGVRKYRTARNAKVLKVDKDHDLALVKVTDKDIPKHSTVPVASEVHAGEDVHIVGHPSGQWWSYTHGWVAAVRPHADGTDDRYIDAIQISAPVWFGNSGGGAFNGQGELVGIASWLRKGPNFAYFVDYNVIRTFLQQNGIRR